MADRYRVAIIGCGKTSKEEGRTGSGMSHSHANGYQATGVCDIVALADIRPENAEAFAERHELSAKRFTDYQEMLAAEKPDIVSICTWPHLHAPMVQHACAAGVRAIHCEKPMAPTWGAAKRMHAAAVEHGVQLTFNHQRRFLSSFRTARKLVLDGVIGELQRLEAHCPNMIDWGTHWLDMLFFFNGESPAVWVLGQIDSREESSVFGLPLENQAISQIKFQNGVRGVMFTGYDSDIGCQLRLIGAEGVIELHNPAPHLRLRGRGDGEWRCLDTEGLHGEVAIHRAIADLTACLGTGREPELSSYRAVRATEVIFATYESSRRRGRVDLPLEAEDSAFLTMLEAGEVGPPRAS